MADMYAVSGETLTGIADAIRSKTGSDEQMTVAAMVSAIEGISEYNNRIIVKTATVIKEDTSGDLVLPFDIPNYTVDNIISLLAIRKGFADEIYDSSWVGIGYSKSFSSNNLTGLGSLSVNVTRDSGEISYYNVGVSSRSENNSIILTNSRTILRSGEYVCALVYSEHNFPKGI